MTKKEIEKKVRAYLDSVEFPYDDAVDEYNFTVVYEENGNHRTKGKMPIYNIGFRTQPIHSEQLLYFMIMAAETYELEYIMGPTNYVEIKK